MRKYRCNRILEDRKISRRLCAPFFFPLSYENGRGQRKVEQLSAPLLRFTGAPPKILFRTRMIRERIQRTDGCVIRIPKMLSSFVRKRYTLRSHENYSKTIPPARCESEETRWSPSIAQGSGMRFQSTARNRRIPRMIVHIVSAFVHRHT